MNNNKKYLMAGVILFVLVPVLLYLTGEFPRRKILKEFLSLLTILIFFLITTQFLMSRSGRSIMKDIPMGTVMKIHKFIGYLLITVLAAHPFFIVLPRYFESGAAPGEALTIMLADFSGSGVIAGMAAYVLMLVIGITSFFRNQLPMKYITWRKIHGILSVFFIFAAAWHAVDLGRHMDLFFSFYVILTALWAVLLLLRIYFPKIMDSKEGSND